MCLSTVYKNTMEPESLIMRNVMRIDCKDGCVILTDLMERQVTIEGSLEMANLVDGFVIVIASESALPVGAASGRPLRVRFSSVTIRTSSARPYGLLIGCCPYGC